MAKKQKVLIFLLAILFGLILYLILTSESIKPANDAGRPVRPDSSVSLETDYQLRAGEFFRTLEALIKNNNFTGENIRELKNKWLALKVPAKFKELHLKFVLVLGKMENYLSRKDEREKSESFRAVSQLKADYSWLNN